MKMRMLARTAFATLGFLICASNSDAQQCNMNQKQIVFSYRPQFCLNEACQTTQKLLFIGARVLAYFKKSGSVEAFKSVGAGSASEGNASVGFEYKINTVIDALSDPSQASGLKFALAQLSPGTKYRAYTIRASQAGNTFILEDAANLDMPYIGLMTVEITTSVQIDDCRGCKAGIVVSTVVNGSRSADQLPVQSCEIFGM
jgi:hypothetical protein